MHYTEICSGFLLGPLIYFYCSRISGDQNINISFKIIHLIPFFIGLAIITFVNITEPSHFIESSKNSMLLPIYNENKLIYFLISFCNIYLLFYFLLTFRKLFLFSKTKIYKFEFKIALLFITIIIINQFILATGNIFNLPTLKTLGIVILSLFTIAYAFFSFRYPEFAIRVIKEARNIRYRNSLKESHNTLIIEERLLQLMNEEKLFRSTDLTLTSLSEILLIKPHELSRILNKRFDNNFNNFINIHRIKESKNMLQNDPEKTILEIAFAVGFNSNSAFYASFSKIMNISPNEYRKKFYPDL